MELNERMAQLRKEHGLSQNDLAEKLNVSRQAVSRWEQGLAMPSSDNLIYLSRLYGITLDELIYPRDESKEQKTTQKIKRKRIGFFLCSLQYCLDLSLELLFHPVKKQRFSQ